jgi:carbon starvation protein
MDYWYHFAIMFEALFILTTIDTGTRVARFLVQEFLGQFYAPMARQEWIPGSVVSTLLVVTCWSYFIWTGSISTIWPMFGIANQLLASVALAVGTTIIINQGKARYAWVTLMPMSFVSVSTLTAGAMSVRDNFMGYIDTFLTVIMMVCVVIILTNAVWRWMQVLRGRVAVAEATS